MGAGIARRHQRCCLRSAGPGHDLMRVTGDDGVDAGDPGDGIGGVFGPVLLAVARPAMAECHDHIRAARAQARDRAPAGGDDIFRGQLLGKPGLPFDGLRGQHAEDADGDVLWLAVRGDHPAAQQRGFRPERGALQQAGIGHHQRIARIGKGAAQEIDTMGKVVIAERRRIIAKPVQRRDGGVHVMRAKAGAGQFVRQRRAVEQVAIVEKQQIGMDAALRRDQGCKPRQPAAPCLGAEMHMEIGGGEDAQRDRNGCFRAVEGRVGCRGTSVRHYVSIAELQGHHDVMQIRDDSFYKIQFIVAEIILSK